MAYGDSNRISLRFSTETNWGETPATPTMQELRISKEAIKYNKTTAVTAEIRKDRQVSSIAQTGVDIQGTFDFDFSLKSFETLIQAAMCGTYTTLSQTLAGVTTVAAGAKTITRASGSFIVDGVVAGMWLKFGAFTNAANNAWFRVVSLTATVLTVEDPGAVLVNESSTSGVVTYKAKQVTVLASGLPVYRSFLMERAYLDISQFMYFTGNRISTFGLNLNSRQIITGSFGIMGKLGVLGGATISGSITSALTTDVLTASANVGNIQRNGANLAAGVKSATISLSNNMRLQDVVGNLYPGGVGIGECSITGTLSAYFSDNVLMNDAINHATVELSFTFGPDSGGNVMFITIPAVKLKQPDPNAGGKSQDIMVPLQWEAQIDPLTGVMMTVDIIQ